MTGSSAKTCSDYREQMTLLALRNRLNDTGLSEDEKRQITEEIRRLEKRTGLQ
jgi:hypothetical protein